MDELIKNIGQRIAIARSSLHRSTGLRDFIRIVPDSSVASGFQFESILTGQRWKEINQAADHVMTLGITDYRTFGPSGKAIQGSRAGASHIAEEAKYLSEQLLQATTAGSTQRAALENAGLGHLIGEQLTVEYAKFDYKESTNLKAILDEVYANKGTGHSVLNVNDEGVTVIRYRNKAGQILSTQESKKLQYALGVGSLNESFVGKALGADAAKNVAKLPKRYKALFSARGVSIAGEDLQATLDLFHLKSFDMDYADKTEKFEKKIQRLAQKKAEARGLSAPEAIDLRAAELQIHSSKEYISFLNSVPPAGGKSLGDATYYFNDVESFFKGLFDIEGLSREEKFLLSYGTGLTNKESTKLAVTKGSILKKDLSDPNSLASKLQKSLKQMVQDMTQIEGSTEIDAFVDRLGRDFASAKDFKDFKSIIEDLAKNGTTDEDRIYGGLAQSLLGGVEKMRDGQALYNQNFLKARITTLKNELNQLKGRISGPVGIAEQSEIDSLERQIEKIQFMIDNPYHRHTVRGAVNLFGESKSLKFEAGAVKLPKFMRDYAQVVYGSSLKGEIGQGKIESILMDIATSHEGPVRVDPLMLMYHPDYFGSDQFFENMQGIVQSQSKKIDDFMKRGIVPESVLEQIEREAAGTLDQYTGLLRVQKSRAKAQAIEIQRLMRTGAKPTEIPALVNRVIEEMQTQAFTMKGDKVLMTMPDTTRGQIATLASQGVTGPGPAVHREIQFATSAIRDKNAITALGVSRNATETLKFMDFDVRDGMILINNSSTHLFHHALGTFDLDDKSLTMPLQFTDANGKNRMSFMVMRQPTGFQERIFAASDLSKKENIANLMRSRMDDNISFFEEIIGNNPAELSLTPREMDILSQVKDSLVSLKNSSKGKRSKRRFKRKNFNRR